jgi:nicotinate (nicotinamide) nucleotide adenylyltransferase
MPELHTLRWLRRAPRGLADRAGRLGVLSGTFNPPTLAHLALAQRALDLARLDEVLLVLPEAPPHKRDLEAPLADRAAMLERLAELDPRLSAAVTARGLFLEIHAAVAPNYPAGTRQHFLAGRDAAQRILLDWPYSDPRQALEEMFARFDVIVAERGGAFTIPVDSLLDRFRARIHTLEMPAEWEGVSATEVRRRLAEGEPINALVPATIVEYIRQRHLYRAKSAGEG